jgi:hypothetical protein
MSKEKQPVRRRVYAMEAIRSGIGVSVQLDLGETLLTMDERKFFQSIHGPAYSGEPGDRDVFIELGSGWTGFRIPESAWFQLAQTRQKIRDEDMAALAEVMKEGEIVSEAEG